MAAAVALFFLARLTQVGWVYLLDSVLWGALLLSAVMPWLTTLFLAAQRSLPPPGVSGAKAWPSDGGQIDIQVTLRNRVFWPRFLLNLDYRCPPAQPQRVRLFVAKLNGSQRARLTSTIDLHQRGNHLLGPVFAESSAPFGLFRRRCELTPAEPLLVYPMVHTLARLPVADAISEAAAQSKRSRSGLEPAGARRYVSGDPRRNIPWRNTARVGQPMVKEFDDPRTPFIWYSTPHRYGVKAARQPWNTPSRSWPAPRSTPTAFVFRYIFPAAASNTPAMAFQMAACPGPSCCVNWHWWNPGTAMIFQKPWADCPGAPTLWSPPVCPALRRCGHY